MARPGPLLRLVHSLERRRAGRTYSLALTLRDAGAARVVNAARYQATGPRAFVVGSGERVELSGPTGATAAASTLLPRHVALLVVPLADRCIVRAVSLHPDKGIAVLPLEADVQATPPDDHLHAVAGGVVARDGVRLFFDGFSLEIRAALEPTTASGTPTAGAGSGPASGLLEVLPLGAQLAFHDSTTVRAVGDVISSIGGPEGGGHAIPALVNYSPEQSIQAGALVLRSRAGISRVEVRESALARGVLVGRSRRCVLGRGFDENDGLSRVHALVLALDDGVFAFDLASRYGLRDVSRPSRLLAMARLDDGVGCLVYGAGYLTYEP